MDAREDDLLRSAPPLHKAGPARFAPPAGLLALLADLGSISFAVALLGWALPAVPGTLPWRAVGVVASILVVLLGRITRSYSRSMLLGPRAGILVLNGVAPAAVLSVLSAAGLASVPAWPLAILAVLLPTALLAGREALALALVTACRADLLQRDRVAVIAVSREAADALVRRLRAEPDCSEVHVVPAAAALQAAWTPEGVDRIVVRAAGLPAGTVEALRTALRSWPGPVDFVGSPPAVPSALPHAEERGRLPVFARKRAPLTRLERAAKRGVDIVVSALALLVLSPLLVTLALLMQASRGQALVRLRRDDFRGRPLGVYAFPAGEERGLGETLQRTGLAQLPALLNVLRGDLSLVGPAPLDPRTSDGQRRAAAHAARQGLRPGLAQPVAAGGRDGDGLPPSRDWTPAMLAYCDEWSLGLDLVVLAGAIGDLCTPEHRAWA